MPRTKRVEVRSRGQIIPKGDGNWLLRYYLGRDGDGKRLYGSKTFLGTYKEAEREITRLHSAKDDGVLVAPSKVSLCEYLSGFKMLPDLTAAITKHDGPKVEAWRGWLGGRRDLSLVTRESYEKQLRCYILPDLGHLRLDRITKQRLQEHVRTLEVDKGLSRRSIELTMTVLKSALGHAVEGKLLSHNPADRLILPIKAHAEMVVWSPEEIGTFLTATKGSPWFPLWAVLLTTGLRPQEALALRWSDVTWDTATLTILRAVKTIRGLPLSAGETKTSRSRRKVVVPGETLDILKTHRARQVTLMLKAGAAYNREEDLVFATHTGGFLHRNNILKEWHKAVAKTDLPPMKLYGARHSHQTALLDAGEPPQAVAERGGHSVEVLLTTYAHVLPGTRQRTSDTIGKLVYHSQAL